MLRFRIHLIDLNPVLQIFRDLNVSSGLRCCPSLQVRDFFNTNTSGDHSKDDAVIISAEGRVFPIEVFYVLDPVPDYIQTTIETIKKIHHSEPPGDILAFLTGQDDIDTVVRALIAEARQQPRDAMRMRVLPMHGGLPRSDQLKVFERISRSTRKIVVATNIAEASLTIDGIVYVVDAGFVKMPAYNASCGIETLVIAPISQASADQRAGRAGRVRSGKVLLLLLLLALYGLHAVGYRDSEGNSSVFSLIRMCWLLSARACGQ